MEKHSTEFVGLDVHKETTAIGRASAGRAVGRFVGTVGPTLAELLKSLRSVGRPEELSIVYEAGPCGYGLVRELRSRGYACEVIAPSKIPRRSGDRVKTDRRNAVRLAELARAGELVSVRKFPNLQVTPATATIQTRPFSCRCAPTRQAHRWTANCGLLVSTG